MADNVAITAGSGTTIATDEVSSAHYQRTKRSVGADGAATDFLDKHSRADTFTGTGNGTTVDVSAQGMSKFSMQVKMTGTVTSWTAILEGSLDGTNFSPLLTHTNADPGDGLMMSSGPAAFPCLHFRTRCSALTLGAGTNIIVTIIAKP